MFESREETFPKCWLNDGRSILFLHTLGKVFYELPLTGQRQLVALLRSEFDKDDPIISSDGKWIAYNSAESGRWETYVAAFPTFTEKLQVSGSGGCQPLWSRDGKELFFLTLDGKLMGVELKRGATLQTGVPVLLFQTSATVIPTSRQYCVSADGKKFIINQPIERTTTPFTIVLNWSAGLKR